MQGSLLRMSWGYLTVHFACTRRAHSVTLRRSDNKVHGMVINGPLIPCERRLRKLEI